RRAEIKEAVRSLRSAPDPRPAPDGRWGPRGGSLSRQREDRPYDRERPRLDRDGEWGFPNPPCAARSLPGAAAEGQDFQRGARSEPARARGEYRFLNTTVARERTSSRTSRAAAPGERT